MPNKHALIIGIDHYSNLEERYQLRGCVNDAMLMKQLLVEHFKFDEGNIFSLHNTEASHKAIIHAMEELVERVQDDDIVVFHYSGHGSQRKSLDLSEGTGMNSTICPSDSGYIDPYPNLDITDDSINEWLGRLANKTPYISLTFDCCHSGTITRDALGAKARGLPSDTRSLNAMGIDTNVLAPPAAKRRAANKHSNWLTLSDSYVVMSGCRDDEFSYEYASDGGGEPVQNGALTHFLSQALLNAKPGTTYRDAFELARNGVNARFKTQHPQIEGAQDREIFGVNDIEPLRFISVSSVQGNIVTLAGGCAHGLRVDSLWAVYPAGIKTTDGISPLATLIVTTVGAISAQASIVKAAASFGAGARCVESAPGAQQFRLSVDVSHLDAPDAAHLTALIAPSPLLSLASTTTTSDAAVHILSASDQLGLSASLPSDFRLEAPSWAVLDLTGNFLMPLHALSNESAASTIISNLETIARYRNALTLYNPDSRLNVEFNLYHVDDDNQLHNINGQDFIFEDGQNLALEIINHEATNVFVSLLDFGLTGKVSLFYPPRSSSEMIGPGKTLRLGDDARKITLNVLPDFIGTQGTETVKAIFTSEQSDFRWLQQGGTRSLETSYSSMRQQFEAAYHGPTTRNMSFEPPENTGSDWKAISRSFNLRRRSTL